MLRKHLGYSDNEVCEYIELYGLEWVYQAYKYLKEEEYISRTWDLHVIQAAQTPQSKKGAKAMEKYIKKLYDAVQSQVPWMKAEKTQKERRKRGEAPKPKVVLEGVPKEIAEFFENLEDDGLEVQQVKK